MIGMTTNKIIYLVNFMRMHSNVCSKCLITICGGVKWFFVFDVIPKDSSVGCHGGDDTHSHFSGEKSFNKRQFQFLLLFYYTYILNICEVQLYLLVIQYVTTMILNSWVRFFYHLI